MVEASNNAEEEAKQKVEDDDDETPEQEDARKKAERERQLDLMKPLVDENKAWEATLSEDDR